MGTELWSLSLQWVLVEVIAYFPLDGNKSKTWKDAIIMNYQSPKYYIKGKTEMGF